jgi:hypothetical protein
MMARTMACSTALALAAVLVVPAARPADAAAKPLPGDCAFSQTMTSDATTVYYLSLDAEVPERLGLAGLGLTVWVNGQEILPIAADRKATGANAPYEPFFLVDGVAPRAKLTFLPPVAIPAGETKLEVRSASGRQVHSVEFHPAMPAVTANADFGRDFGVYSAGQRPQGRVSFHGPVGQRLRGRMVIQQLRLADGAPAGFGTPEDRVTQAARVAEVPLDLALGATGTAETKVSVPDKQGHGLYGVTVVLSEGKTLWAKFLGAAAIVPRRDTSQFRPDGKFLVSCGPAQTRDFTHAAAYKRLGIDWVRSEIGWGAFEAKRGLFDWSLPDAFHEACRHAKLLSMNLASHAPDWARPNEGWEQRPDPRQGKKGTRLFDTSPAPAHLGDWQNAWRLYLDRYKDVHRAINVWNEPWEGHGISGWQSTGEHYRQLVRHVRQARDAVDPSIPVVAADSSDNTARKLLLAGRADDVDVLSIHYEMPVSCSSFAMARHYQKRVWDTETWLAYQGDAATIRRALYEIALGAEKVSLWTDSMLFDFGHGWPTPQAVSLAACAHVLDGLTFRKVVHPERPPFVLLFSGPDRHVAAVASHLVDDITRIPGNFRDQFAHDRLTMELALPSGKCKVYDLLANPLKTERGRGKFEIPVDEEVRYIEFSGPVDDFEKALGRAVYRGLRPVEITLQDITAPIGAGAELAITLRNAHPFPIRGTLRVEAAGLKLGDGVKDVALEATAQKQFAFAVTGAEPGANGYPVKVIVETDQGRAELSETISVAVIGRGSPRVDGDVSEWPSTGAVPVLLTPQKQRAGAGQTFDPQQPWEGFAQQAAEFAAQVAFTADARFLYMMARVKDPDAGKILLPSMLSGKDLHEYYPSPADHVYRRCGPRPPWIGPVIHLSLGPETKGKWVEQYETFPPDHPLYRFASHMATEYHYMIYPTEGGGAEVLRMRTPEFTFHHPYPVNFAWMAEHCRVAGAQAKVRMGNAEMIYEAAIPWSELRTVPHEPHDRIRLSFRVTRGRRDTLEWSLGRSAASRSCLDWDNLNGHQEWSAETLWGLADQLPQKREGGKQP